MGSVLFNAINTPSTLSVFDTNGNYTLVPSTPGYGIEIINPLAQLDNTFNDYKLKKLNGSVRFDYDLINHLKLTGRMGFNTSNSDGKSFAKEVSYGGKVFDVVSSFGLGYASISTAFVFDIISAIAFPSIDFPVPGSPKRRTCLL